ncbi:MAG TPA: D-glycero-beta-D-manno-heptose-7-phosphate kinase [Vicinamibacterales bacterium]|jgi:D-beta-D-heptose 7-phosphate kinase/D-beta-D-heptose 1-phosphate adenosyltransferase|nr:D-glycero-beta-D-manno-heptose-7-phosphate kinase [Vicinamibacterales bacterium]
MSAPQLPPISAHRAREIIDAFPRAAVLVIGDVMLDRFLVGRVTRISPEAPVPIVTFDHESRRVGGAANVAHNIRALGGRVELVGVVGRDEAGEQLVASCREAGIRTTLAPDPGRRTTTKVRVVTERNQQVARIDYEQDTEVNGVVEATLLAELERRGNHVAAIVVSDYLKGCITRDIMRAAVGLGEGRGIPVLVDPKIPHLDYYPGATIVTPNHQEAETATHMRVRTHNDARNAAREFLKRARCGGVLMTRGDQGMWLLADGVEAALPASAREVADVTGAGDTVIATLALTMASGGSIAEAAWLANEAAGLVVAKFGPSVVTPEELQAAMNQRLGTRGVGLGS